VEAEAPKALYPLRAEPGGMGMTIVGGRVRHLNSTSCLIYASLDGKCTIGGLVDRLAEAFPEVDREELFVDSVRAIRELQYCGMVSCRSVSE
jgi:hypothetical protein